MITVSGQTDTAKHTVSISGQSQNNITVPKKKKATTMSKPQQEKEKKGKNTFTFTDGRSKGKIVKCYAIIQSLPSRSQTIQFTACMLLIDNKCKAGIARLNKT